MKLPARVVATAERSAEGRAWLSCLPGRVAELAARWSLDFEARGGADMATCSFVAFVRCRDGTPAALKLGVPDMEALQEADGLRFWSGDGMVRLLDTDAESGALLIERCEPGVALSSRPEREQDEVIAGLLLRLWRRPPPAGEFRPLAEMLRYWAECARARSADWPDPGFARAGLELLDELGRAAPGDVLLATDLHAGNVLEARREPWLAIDPKPFVGDAAYDATQHLFNCVPRLRADPSGTVARFAELANVSAVRVRLWLVARLAQAVHVRTETYGLSAAEALELARRLEKSV